MQREAPDRHFYAEMRDLNLEFLMLVMRCRQRPGEPVFGLDAAVVDHLRRLGPAQLESMATTPCLLAGLRATPPPGLVRAAEPRLGEESPPAADGCVFAAGLLTYVCQMVRRDPLRAALCAGPAPGWPAAGLRLRDIHACARQARLHLEARFCRHPRFWPDLVCAAREGEPRRLELARLAAIQLAVAELGPVQQPPAVPLQVRVAGAH